MTETYQVTFLHFGKKIVISVRAKDEKQATSKAKSQLREALHMNAIEPDPFLWTGTTKIQTPEQRE